MRFWKQSNICLTGNIIKQISQFSRFRKVIRNFNVGFNKVNTVKYLEYGHFGNVSAKLFKNIYNKTLLIRTENMDINKQNLFPWWYTHPFNMNAFSKLISIKRQFLG